MKRLSVLILLCTTSCIGILAHVRQSDVDSWKGVNKIELETHSFFSTLNRRMQHLSDGDELWTYSNCDNYTDPVICSGNSHSMQCSGGATRKVCCHNQFLIRDDVVIAYRPVGVCMTDCSVVPASKPCNTFSWN